jgi:hypothetical protein
MPITVRKGQGDVKLTREEFERRRRERFADPAFQRVEQQIADIIGVAFGWRHRHRTRSMARGCMATFST